MAPSIRSLATWPAVRVRFLSESRTRWRLPFQSRGGSLSRIPDWRTHFNHTRHCPRVNFDSGLDMGMILGEQNHRRTLRLLCYDQSASPWTSAWGNTSQGLVDRRRMHQNRIMVMKPSRWEGMWVFDDTQTGLVREAFAAGVPPAARGRGRGRSRNETERAEW